MGKKLERLQRMLVIINKLKGLQRYVPREELETSEHCNGTLMQ